MGAVAQRQLFLAALSSTSWFSVRAADPRPMPVASLISLVDLGSMAIAARIFSRF